MNECRNTSRLMNSSDRPKSYGSNCHFGDRFQTVKNTVYVPTSKSKFTFFCNCVLNYISLCHAVLQNHILPLKWLTLYFAIITYSKSL